jgi:hypothetical protein
MIRFDSVRVAGVSPFGATLEVRATIAPVEQRGEVELLVFEDVRINGTAVSVDDYISPFKLPEKRPLTLSSPLTLYVSSLNVLLETTSDLINRPKVLPITGRVYVCGRFKRLMMNFKRAVPVEIQTSIANPF